MAPVDSTPDPLHTHTRAPAGPYLSLALRRLAPGVESQDLGDALMCVLGDALYYDAALTLGVLGQQGALAQALQALHTTIFANRKSGGSPAGGCWAARRSSSQVHCGTRRAGLRALRTPSAAILACTVRTGHPAHSWPCACTPCCTLAMPCSKTQGCTPCRVLAIPPLRVCARLRPHLKPVIPTPPCAGKMKHYSSPREKKVLILGLVALLALPDSQLPAEVKPGMPQVGTGWCGARLARQRHAPGQAGRLPAAGQLSRPQELLWRGTFGRHDAGWSTGLGPARPRTLPPEQPAWLVQEAPLTWSVAGRRPCPPAARR